MTSLIERYRSGEYIEVWDKLRAFGANGPPQALFEDAREVAVETMTRVAINIDRIIE